MTQPKLLLCDCAGSQRIDAAALAEGTGLACSRVHRMLCRDEARLAGEAMRAGPVVIACAQEAATFADLAEEVGAAPPPCIDIRDRAGWSDAANPAPKMAALIAAARLAGPAVPTMDVQSDGVCLVLGSGEQALDAAGRLAGALTVTCLLTAPVEIAAPPAFDLALGRVRRAAGALGGFAVEVDGFAALSPAGRGARGFAAPRDGARSECDLIVDLTGGVPLFPAHHKRDGYLRADPGDPLAVERALFEAVQMVGTFEKPLHVRMEPALCAHSRAGQTGCTRCLDLCPTAAIRPDGDAVAVDPHICAGCMACASACPSGAVAADAPPVGHLLARVRVLAETYRKAGGRAPRLLVHDDHGAEMIRLAARHGTGLPGDVIPLEVEALAGFGHAEQLAALALGFVAVDLLPGPRTETGALAAQIALTEAVAAATVGAGRVRLLDAAEPDALCEVLRAEAPAPHDARPILPVGERRSVARLSAQALAGAGGAGAGAAIPLPAGAPYGRIEIDTGKCTLCLACVSLCPPGALGDNPDRPQVTFREDACLQCGICATVCPETAIRLEPRFDLSEAALRAEVLHEEEPFCCIECGTAFGVKSTIEKITARLAGHAMFTNSDNARLIQMCDDCRVRAQYHAEAQPFRMGDRPRVRTTDDYKDGGEPGT